MLHFFSARALVPNSNLLFCFPPISFFCTNKMTIYEEMSTVFKNKTGNTKGGQYALHHVSLAIEVTIMMLFYADHKANTTVVALEKLFK